MPGLYNITSNANVSVGDTIGLYQQSGGNVYILNNAQQLLNTLSQNGNVNFALDPAYANTRVLAFTADIGTTAGTYGSDLLIPVVTVSGDGRITSITEVNISGALGSYGNANVAAYLPTYTGTLDNSSTIIALVANAGAQATDINTLFANAAVQSIDISTLFANAAAQATSINSLTANAAAQALLINTINANVTAANLHIQTIDANLGAFETYVNATFSTSTYSNANVAAYLLTNTGDIQAGNITVQGTLFSNDITAAAVLVDGDTTITGNLLVLGNTTTINSNVITTNDKTITVANNISNSTLLDGAGLDAGQTAIATWRFNTATTSWQSNIAITPASNAVSNLGGTANYWDNVYAVKYFGDGSSLANLPVQTGTYSNTNVAAYIASNTDPVISSLVGNAAVQALQIDALNANVTAANLNIQTLDANLGAFETYTNSTIATLQANLGSTQIWANANIQTLSANLGAFETYANATFGAGSYGNANVAAYLPVYGGNIAATVTTASQPYISGIGRAGFSSTVTGNNQKISIGASNTTANLQLTPGAVRVNNNSTFEVQWNDASFTACSTSGIGGNITVDATAAANRFSSTTGYFWANGDVYTGNYSNVQVAAYLPTFTGNLGGNLSTAIQPYVTTLGTPAQSTVSRAVYGGNITLAANTNNAFPGNISLFAGNAVSSTYGTINLQSTVIRLGEETTPYPNLSEIRVFAPLSVYPGANTGNIASFYQGNVRISNEINATAPGATNYGGYLYVGNTISTGSILSSSGYFWANGTAYSTGGGGGSNFTSNLTVNSNYIVDAILDTTREKTSNIGVIQGVVTIDANLGGIQTATVTANITINTNNLTNFNTGESVTLVLTQNTNANLRLLTSNLKYAGGSKILSSANAAIDTISITYDGTNYLASLVKGYA